MLTSARVDEWLNQRFASGNCLITGNVITQPAKHGSNDDFPDRVLLEVWIIEKRFIKVLEHPGLSVVCIRLLTSGIARLFLNDTENIEPPIRL